MNQTYILAMRFQFDWSTIEWNRTISRTIVLTSLIISLDWIVLFDTWTILIYSIATTSALECVATTDRINKMKCFDLMFYGAIDRISNGPFSRLQSNTFVDSKLVFLNLEIFRSKIRFLNQTSFICSKITVYLLFLGIRCKNGKNSEQKGYCQGFAFPFNQIKDVFSPTIKLIPSSCDEPEETLTNYPNLINTSEVTNRHSIHI